MSSTSFRRLVWQHYKTHGRHALPWRKTRNPYRILVSEVMLQQTQVERVVPYYQAFIKQFPSVRALARARLSEVLRAWQGLGYNRRAKMLHEAASAIVDQRKGIFPKTVSALEELPGVGSYTARAVIAFAYNQDVIFIETNIRTAVVHTFFKDKSGVDDKEVLRVLKKLHPRGRSREWYAALMDYGASLKRSGVKLNAKSKHYTKQSKFVGSNREARGILLKALATDARPASFLANLLDHSRRSQVTHALSSLVAEGLVQKLKGRRYRLPP